MHSLELVPSFNVLKNWPSQFEAFSALQNQLKIRIATNSNISSYNKGRLIFGSSKSPQNMLFILSGTVCVQQVSETGREIVLYRVEAGQVCVLTTACLASFDQFSAEGRAETDVVLAYISKGIFDQLVMTSTPFRDFVGAVFAKRITDLFLVIDEIAFQRVDIRLAKKLNEISKRSNILKITHQGLATELGTAREVISRQLKEFKKRGWITQSRGKITVVNAEKLASFS
jgi:CRP/FNR family transcriptional regulator